MKKLISFLVFAALLVIPVGAANQAIVSKNPNESKNIALTFDDGPHPEYTDEILKILDEYHIKATFFVLGSNAEKEPKKIQEIFSKGHEIGNHTYSHKFISELCDKKLKEEITRTENIIYTITGKRPVVFRPPGGAYNDRAIDIVCEMGYRCILWSKDSKDWRMLPANSVAKNITNGLCGGDILLFHDFNKENSPTPEALRKVLPELIKQGYHFVTVSELFKGNEPM